MDDVDRLEKLIAKTTDRIIKPVEIQRYKHHDIVAIANHQVLFESGELVTLEQFTDILPTLPRLIVVKRGVADFVTILDERYGDDPTWQWRVTVKERDVFPIDQSSPITAIQVSTVVHYFGWGFGLRKDRAYHLALDPITFYGKSFDDVWKIERSLVEELMSWATVLRKWCYDNNLGIRPTNGGISSQFLTDPRFYPECRRKVPRNTNDRARENLPGNHYHLFASSDPEREYQAYYLDQRNAHHYHAEHTRLPNSNSLYAFGRFYDLGDIVFPTTWSEFSGLYCLRLCVSQVPGIRDFSPLTHTIVENTFDAFVWSNEIQLLTDLGYEIRGVIAAWGTIEEDTGISEYARWAQMELKHYSGASWLKPILLSTYGVLAAKPRSQEIIFKRAKGKVKPVATFTGKKELYGLLVGATGKDKRLEPKIVNVLHRGLIEAATRSESLGYAHYLANQGYNVLSIYADGIIIEDEGETSLPFLPEPWRLQNTLHHLRFINKQAFISGEVSKLPGVLSRADILPISRSHRNPPSLTSQMIGQMYG